MTGAPSELTGQAAAGAPTTAAARPLGQLLLLSVAVAAAYFVASKLAMSVFAFDRTVATLSPAAGIALAAVLLWGPRLLPAVFAGCLLADLAPGASMLRAIGASAVSTACIAAAYLALVHVARIDIGLRRVYDVLALTLLGAGLVGALKAAAHAVALVFGAAGAAAGALMPAAVNGLAAGVGILVLAPAGLAWYADARRPVPRGQRIELALLALVVVGTSLLVFSGVVSPMLAGAQLPYALFPVMFWAGLRFGVREVAAALLIAGIVAATCSALGRGPFAREDTLEGLVGLYLFVAALAVTALMLAAALHQRSEADAAVRESERRRRLLLERMNEGLVMQDRDGVMTYVSDRFCEITGYRRDELLGKTGREITVPHEAARWEERHRLRQRGVAESFELTLVRKNGERMDAYISPRPFFNERGEYTGSFALLTDVTARRRAEARLRESEALYRLLVENQTEIIVTFGRDGALTFVSPSYRQLFGAAEEALLGRPLALEVHEDDREATARAWQSVWRPPYAASVECRVMTPQGWRWLAWSVRAIRDGTADAAPGTAVAVARDVTDRRRAEEQARQHLQSLAHVARVSSMGEMASAIAHEINQPLTAIANYTYACVRLLRGGKATLDEALDAMQKVAAEAERAGEVVRKMRSFVRGDEGQLATVDPNFLVAEVLRLAAPEARQSGVELLAAPGAGVAPVLADSIQIQQVLLNLVRNAVEAVAADEGVEREVVVSTAPAEPGFVEIVVTDTGPGLAPEALEKVFEPFYTTKPDGIGIGLALSRSIVDAHGGRLWAAQRAGRGAEFHVKLPAAPEESDA